MHSTTTYDTGAHPDDVQGAVLDVEAVARAGSWVSAIPEEAWALQGTRVWKALA